MALLSAHLGLRRNNPPRVLRPFLPLNDELVFIGREKEIARLRGLYASRCHLLIVGPAGVGKSALLRQVRQSLPLLLCEETSSIRRICEGLERQLGWTHREMNVVERKNRLLPYLLRRAWPGFANAFRSGSAVDPLSRKHSAQFGSIFIDSNVSISAPFPLRKRTLSWPRR